MKSLRCIFFDPRPITISKKVKPLSGPFLLGEVLISRVLDSQLSHYRPHFNPFKSQGKSDPARPGLNRLKAVLENLKCLILSAFLSAIDF